MPKQVSSRQVSLRQVSKKKLASSKDSNKRIQDLLREQTNIILDIRKAIHNKDFCNRSTILQLLDEAYEDRPHLTDIQLLLRPKVDRAIMLFLQGDIAGLPTRGLPDWEYLVKAISMYHEQLQLIKK